MKKSICWFAGASAVALASAALCVAVLQEKRIRDLEYKLNEMEEEKERDLRELETTGLA